MKSSNYAASSLKACPSTHVSTNDTPCLCEEIFKEEHYFRIINICFASRPIVILEIYLKLLNLQCASLMI